MKDVEDFYSTDKKNLRFWLAKLEKYSRDRVVAACVAAGAKKDVAEMIADEIDGYVDNRVKMSDVRPLIFALLQRYDQNAARRFKGSEIYVRTSVQTFERFDRSKISKSLVREAEIDENMAEQIAFEVEHFIRTANLDYVSSSLIREITNVKLLQHGLEEARKLYTRVGMPVWDVTQLIEVGIKENANLQYNPETIHKVLADEMIREYTLLKFLPRELSDAHLRGLIHIHDLDYFCTRPFCFSHDLRFFLKRGYVADGEGLHTAAAGPAKKAEVAFLHSVKVLASAQVNCAGGQGYNWYNIILAPYVRGLDYKRIKQLCQMTCFELSQMFIARGGQTIFSSIDLEPDVPKVLLDIPAVQPGGIVQDSVTYADYQEEALQLFRAFTETFAGGDYYGKPFNFPKFEVKISNDLIKHYPEEYRAVAEVAAKFGSPYYFVQQPWMPEFSCYQCCAYMMPLSEQNDQNDLINGTVRGGALQVVTINLPRIAYEATDEARMFDILQERINLTKRVLMIKQNLIHRRLKGGMLPFLAQAVDDKGTPYLDVDKQALEIGFVGLNEFLKAYTGKELHEDKDAWTLGLKVMQRMRKMIDELSRETGMKFTLSRTPAESCAHRLAKIDVKEFNGKAIVQGSMQDKSVYYTNSFHVRPNADIPLLQRMQIEAAFHPIVVGGAMSHIWLGEAQPNAEALNTFTQSIVKKTLMAYFSYTKDLTICRKCQNTAGGVLQACPRCGATDIDWWSRITGYYSPVKAGWNAGKRQEFIDRRRYVV